MAVGLSSPVAHVISHKVSIARRTGKPLRLKKPLVQLAPRGLEREYQRAILRIVRRLENLVRDRLFPRLQEIVAQSDFEKPMREDADTAADMVAELMNSTELWFDQAFQPHEAETIAEELGYQIADFNKIQLNKTFRSVLSVDVIHSEPWLTSSIKAFTKEGADLITKIPRDMKDRIAQTIYRDMRKGLRHEEIAKDLTKGFGFSENRAALIGRDQTNKFNGHLTELRQTEAGITSYIWRTAMDERVRESHQEMEGTKQDWDDPPTVDDEEVHPGEPINCRCYAEPVFDDLSE